MVKALLACALLIAPILGSSGVNDEWAFWVSYGGIGSVKIKSNYGLVWCVVVGVICAYFAVRKLEYIQLVREYKYPSKLIDWFRLKYFGFIVSPAIAMLGLLLFIAVVGNGMGYLDYIGVYVPVQAWRVSNLLFLRDLIILTVVAPVLEEILFRRILFKTLASTIPDLMIIFITATVFSLCHQNMLDGINLRVFIIHFISGVVLGWIYVENGLLASVSLHWGMNLSLVCLYIISNAYRPGLGI